jgi:hypothetical protein
LKTKVLYNTSHERIYDKKECIIPEGKRPLGRPKLRWEDNIKKYLQKMNDER